MPPPTGSQQQPQQQPAAHPTYILRAHAAAIQTATFLRGNTRLVTGDAQGWIVVWCVASRRARAVWRAHEEGAGEGSEAGAGAALLRCVAWGGERLVTHGRDNRLLVWKLGLEDEEGMSTVLPVQDEGLLAMHRRRPWLLHALPVNALNFCAFGDCAARGAELVSGGEADELLVAVPNAVRSEAVDIFHLPSERRLYTVAGDGSVNTGMVMAVSLFYRADDGLALVVGFESGHAMVTQMVPGKADEDKEERRWQMLYLSHAHTQPVLSLDLAPDRAHFLTSSADALLAKHPIPARPPGPAGARDLPSTPLKVVRTGHAGQQSLQLRSDGAIFATAGWDARVRVYSARSLRELAVLRWHKTGCYAVAFARVGHGHAGHAGHGEEGDGGGDAGDAGDGGGDGTTISTAPAAPGARALIPKLTTLSVKEARIQKVTTAHWLVAGSKDGKVSLWDIY